MRKRLFIGIEMPGLWQKELARLCQQINEPEVRCTVPQNIHVTVHFLGDVEVELIPDLLDAVKQFADSTRYFELEFDSVIFGPLHRPAKMIWALFKQNQAFQNLVNGVREVTREFASKDDRKNPIPHATIARIKSSIDPTRIQLTQPKLQGSLLVDSIILYDSVLKQTHPEYTHLQKFDLLS